MATLIELKAELAQYKAAIEAILAGGQSYTISAGQGGNSRTVLMADLQKLIDEKNNLEKRIAQLSGRGLGVRLGSGW